MQETLIRQQKAFITTQLNKQTRSDLNGEELEKLREHLGGSRLDMVRERAQAISVYATIDAINPPSWEEGQTEPTLAEVFEWQWDFWAIEDVLRAVRAGNDDAPNVQAAPVKRVLSIDRIDASDRTARGGGGGATLGGGGGGGPFLSGGGGGGGALPGGGGIEMPRGGGASGGQQQSQQTSQGPSADPTKEVSRDFNASFTGRTTNPLYDVRLYRLRMVVEADEVQNVVDHLGRQNFMTVVGLEMWPADNYEDLEAGYFYGGEATVELVLDLETIWLRSWTTKFMPEETRKALNIPLETQEPQQGQLITRSRRRTGTHPTPTLAAAGGPR